MPLPLIEGRSLKKSYGLQVVVNDLSFLISEKQKIALIGRNGAGKSTLLKIITGAEEADAGEVKMYAKARLGIVKQHEELPSNCTALEFLTQTSKKQEWEVQKQAAEFGVHKDHLAQAPSDLSGGYQMRIKLIAMLLDEPNILLLDEPVNYLDLQTLLLLERFLQSYKGSFIIAAHDRTFLQNTCDHTYEIERGKLTTYKGTVGDYLKFKHEQREFQLRTNKKLAKQIAHQQAFVDRFRYKSSLASRAQSKIKRIKKLKGKIANIDADLAKTSINIPSPRFVAGTALSVSDLIIGYPDYTVAKNIDIEIIRGEKIVIAGENGQGKSTFLKTIAGKIKNLDGKYKWWHRADIGYYDQKTEASLIKSETVLQHLTRMAPQSASAERILMMAGDFLFRGDDLDKSTSVLSGGERARLCLAGVLLHEHNVLILDEPTNHLDVETTEALALALKAYTGTIIFVSHARTFVNALADKVFEVRSGTLRHYIGAYEEYVEDVAAGMAESIEEIIAPPKEQKKDGILRAEHRARIREHQRAGTRIEKTVETLEKEKSEILAYFFENQSDYSPPRAKRLAEVEEEIKTLEKQWIKAQEQIDTLREQMKK